MPERGTREPLEALRGGGLVGRGEEIGQLDAALGAALDGRGRAVLLAGEPGIGKTRLAQELAARARERGALVLGGRCHEDEGAPAYWPWIQIIRHLHGLTESTSGALDVVQLGSAIAGRVPELPTAPSIESAQARFRLFDGVATFFKDAAFHQPLVLVLEDLQSADPSSLLLLAFLAREIADVRLLVLGTYRETEVARPLAETLAELAREPHSSRLHLRGLGEGDVGALIEIIAGVRREASLVSRVHGETEGNPFFVGELVRLLVSEGRLAEATKEPLRRLGLPEGVRAVIGRRLGRLSDDCRHVLAAAAVIGREFGVTPLEHAAGLARERLLAVLGEAVDVSLIAEDPGVPGRFRFAHALIRETLYQGLNTVERVRLHRRVAEALEQLYGASPEEHVAELAHHFFQAAPGGDVERAVAYAEQAGARALQALGYEDAATHYARALEALELQRVADEARRCDLLLALAEAQTRAGKTAKGEETYLRAAEIARALGDGERLARGALGFGGWAEIEMMGVNEPLIALLEEAERALRDRQDALRAKVLARLAGALLFTASAERRTALCDAAVAIARQTGEDGTLLSVLSQRHQALWGPDNFAERLADANEIVRLAALTGDRQIALAGHLYRMIDLMELGDIPATDGEIEQVARLARELRAPFFLLMAPMARATRARMEGRYDAAEKFAQAALAIGQRAGYPLAGVGYGSHALAMARDRGGLENWVAPHREYCNHFPIFKSARCALAWLYAEIGHHDEARQELDRLAADDFVGLRRDFAWLRAGAFLAETTAILRDAARASVLYELLHPYAERNVVSGVIACEGSASHALGRLAATMERWDDAVRHFEAALTMNTRMGARALVARTQHTYGTTLLARSAEGDRERARALLAQALTTAQELGMTRLADQILATDREVSTDGGVPPDVQPPPALTDAAAVEPRTPAEAVFRREGEYWTIAFEGSVFRLKDRLGLHYLARLLRYPRQEFFAGDLVAVADAPARAEPVAASRRAGIGDAGEMLDPQARAAYRRRLDELRHEHEEAQALNDLERASRTGEEIEFLAHELASAVGLGRARKAGSSSERARLSVTRAIREAFRVIGENNAALGHYFATTIKTGTFCSYTPDPRFPLSWDF